LQEVPGIKEITKPKSNSLWGVSVHFDDETRKQLGYEGHWFGIPLPFLKFQIDGPWGFTFGYDKKDLDTLTIGGLSNTYIEQQVIDHFNEHIIKPINVKLSDQELPNLQLNNPKYTSTVALPELTRKFYDKVMHEE
jgi:hypothetical protein